MEKIYRNLRFLMILALSAMFFISCSEDEMEPVEPSAGFTYTADQLDINFANNSENVSSYSWNFGDGNTSTEESPSHTYGAAGTYTVVLTAKGINGKTVEADQDITIVEDLTADYTVEKEYLDVAFTNTSENAVSFTWNFGDGNTSTEENPSHTYAEAGTYTVVLTATAQGGTEVETSKEVTVVPPPAADYTFDDEGLTVNFTNASENVVTYSWDFGDGNTSTEENPTHTYAEEGTYTVTLTATSEDGTEVVTSKEVTVEVPVDTSLYSIVFITDDSNDDEQIAWLQEKGFNVTIYYNSTLSTAPQEDIDMLNAADLIVIGRSGSSSHFDGDDKTAWNALTAPIILNSQWAARNNRLNWFDNNGNPVRYNPGGGELINAQIQQPDDEAFEEVAIGEENLLPWINTPVNLLYVNTTPNGEVLAESAVAAGGDPGAGAMLFVRFEANTEFYAGSGDTPAGPRTYFGFGADEDGSYYWQLTEEAKAVYFEEIIRLVLL
ncbi:PKD domain-containing protein [Echinicola jeungdonensis]|uniref:PKD domain-containing protein n=1 Tax=Echinicola jeungdonensis TaxID=709343 RepID=A0ABV5J890_9BACT|nr:PKD domain-containing protein [Echinicola jeungdonensis]MDN3669513.1 PKD domain-containing protein [Echinicola jeungdonensis]